MSLNEALELGAQQYADFEQEPLSSRAIWFVMDRLLHGSAYGNHDRLSDKLTALETRAAYYLAYDRYMASRGQRGNVEVDSPVKRLSQYDAHIAEVREAAESEEQRLLIFLSFLSKVHSFYCAKEVMDKDFTFFSHCEAFDFYIQKSPYEEITDQDPVRKDRLIMAPRNFFKSSMSVCDSVNWLLCKPSTRILQLTATLELAKMITKEIRGWFTPDDIENITLPFQAIFASDVRLEQVDENGKHPRVTFLLTTIGKETELICPAATDNRKEAGIMCGSIGKIRTGAHFDVLRADDVLVQENTSTADQIQKVISKIEHASRLISPGGFRDFIGTSYSPADYYAIKRADPGTFALLIRPAKVLKKDSSGATALDRGMTKADLTAVDYNILFPMDKHANPKLTNSYLENIELNESGVYGSQYQLDPRGEYLAVFTEALMEARMIPRERMPQTISRHMLVDPADSAENYSDYSALALLECDAEGIGYITELIRGRLIPSELIYRICEWNHRFKPSSVLIEDSKGSPKMRGDLVRGAKDMGDTIFLDFFKMQNQRGSKNSRISRMEISLQQKRLWFLNSISAREELIGEARDFPRGRYDDLIDVCSFSERVLPTVRPGPRDPYAEECAMRILRANAFDEMIYNASPEDRIDHPVEPLPGVGVEDSPDDLWDPFAVQQPFKK